MSLAAFSTAKAIETGATLWRSCKARPDAALLKALGLAHGWRRTLEAGTFTSFVGLGAAAGLDSNSARDMLRLAFLARDLQRATRDGTPPPTLAVRSILQHPLPALWMEQRPVLGVTDRT